MKVVRIKDLYPETIDRQDFCIITDKINDVFTISKKEEKALQRKEYRYKAHYSLDHNDGIEKAILIYSPSAEEIFFEKMKRQEIRDALKKLTKKQYRRFMAFYDLNLNYAQIARIEKVDPKSVKESIESARKKIENLLELF